MRVKAKLLADVATIKLLIKHPMESGRNKDESGQLIPAHYVTQISGHVAGVQVFEVNTGISVSKNPFIQVILTGRTIGETIDLKWIDSTGFSEEDSITLK
jgi:sulfur-oxidizing protein SoxZ